MGKMGLDKLSQLDRIEYILIEKRLEDNFINFKPLQFLKTVLLYFVFIFGFALLIIKDYPSTAISLFNVLPKILNIGGYIFICLSIGQIISIIKYIKKRNNLQDKFFSIEPRRKK